MPKKVLDSYCIHPTLLCLFRSWSGVSKNGIGVLLTPVSRQVVLRFQMRQNNEKQDEWRKDGDFLTHIS